MTRVKDLIALLEQYFPRKLAEDWDNPGLQIGSREKEVRRIMVALDMDYSTLQAALQQKTDMIITHHPLLFKGIKNIDYSYPLGRIIRELIRADISVFAAHTNLDAAPQGLSQLLAEKIGLNNIELLDNGQSEVLYKIVVYVPTTHVEEVREAINGIGAGHVGNYSDCSFRALGTGTFKPGEDAHPFIGSKGIIEEVQEYRLETVVYQKQLDKAVQAMLKAHPYEEVAYDIYRLENRINSTSLGRIGFLPETLSLQDFALQVKKNLGLDSIRFVGGPDQSIRKVAVVSGAGSSLMRQVIKSGADAFVTGDIKYHEARDAEALGLALIDAGHQGTEEIVVPYLCNLLKKELKTTVQEIEVIPHYLGKCFKYI